MCFRPSAVMGSISKNVQYADCPSCGQPVAASVGITEGECPHCKNPIPLKSTNDVALDSDKKIL